MDYDLHSNVKEVLALAVVNINSDGTTNGITIDAFNFGSIEYLIQDTTLNGGIFTPVLQHSDDGTTWTNLADEDPELVLGGDFVFDDSVAADSNTIKRVGSISKKQFQRITIDASGASGTNDFFIAAVLSNPILAPIANSF